MYVVWYTPYRNEYLCFQKITKLEYSIPDGFPDNAKDVVTKLLVSTCTLPCPLHFMAHVSCLPLPLPLSLSFSLLSLSLSLSLSLCLSPPVPPPPQVLNPSKRLGCDQMGGYATLKDHVFFEDIEWDTMPDQTPPKLMPYLPSTAKGEQGFRSDVNVSTHKDCIAG